MVGEDVVVVLSLDLEIRDKFKDFNIFFRIIKVIAQVVLGYFSIDRQKAVPAASHCGNRIYSALHVNKL